MLWGAPAACGGHVSALERQEQWPREGTEIANIVTGPGETKEDFPEVPMPHRSLAVRGCRGPTENEQTLWGPRGEGHFLVALTQAREPDWFAGNEVREIFQQKTS